MPKFEIGVRGMADAFTRWRLRWGKPIRPGNERPDCAHQSCGRDHYLKRRLIKLDSLQFERGRRWLQRVPERNQSRHFNQHELRRHGIVSIHFLFLYRFRLRCFGKHIQPQWDAYRDDSRRYSANPSVGPERREHYSKQHCAELDGVVFTGGCGRLQGLSQWNDGRHSNHDQLYGFGTDCLNLVLLYSICV